MTLLTDIHAHPAMNAFLWDRDLRRHVMGGDTFNPLASLSDFEMLSRGGVDVLWSALHVPEQGVHRQPADPPRRAPHQGRQDAAGEERVGVPARADGPDGAAGRALLGALPPRPLQRRAGRRARRRPHRDRPHRRGRPPPVGGPRPRRRGRPPRARRPARRPRRRVDHARAPVPQRPRGPRRRDPEGGAQDPVLEGRPAGRPHARADRAGQGRPGADGGAPDPARRRPLHGPGARSRSTRRSPTGSRSSPPTSACRRSTPSPTT